MKIEIDDLSRPQIGALLEEHLASMRRISPPESVHALDVDKLRRPEVTFWSAWDDATLLGCGALKTLDASHGEVKSMRTPERLRRRGAGRALLATIVETARARGLRRLSLETGSQPAFDPAHRLYESFGFVRCGPFGDYTDDPNSVFMTLDLTRSEPACADVLVPMSAAFYETFLPMAVESYARQNVSAGRWPAAGAVELSRAEHARILPAGLATPGMHLYEIRDPSGGATVGTLWFAVQTATGTPTGYVFNIEVDAAHRRAGYARRAFVELEAIARGLGIEAIGLNVFAFNAAARALYEELGYEVLGLTMRKAIGRGHVDAFDRRFAMARRLISSGSSFERDIGYSRAVVDDEWIFVSGTTGFDYAAMTIADDVVKQAEQCMKNIAAALAEAGATMADVVRVRYILPDAGDFASCWPVLRRWLGEVRPAATMISAGLADPRMKIEIEVTARTKAAPPADR